MALTGPAARAVKIGHSPTAEWTDVPNVPYLAGQERNLPPLPRGKKWHQLVERWWAVVRIMPHCALWTDADWLFAEETAQQKQDYLTDPKKKTTAATEIRRREDQMGFTREARRKLRIRYIDADGQVDQATPSAAGQSGGVEPAGVVSLADRRARLSS